MHANGKACVVHDELAFCGRRQEMTTHRTMRGRDHHFVAPGDSTKILSKSAVKPWGRSVTEMFILGSPSLDGSQSSAWISGRIVGSETGAYRGRSDFSPPMLASDMGDTSHHVLYSTPRVVGNVTSSFQSLQSVCRLRLGSREYIMAQTESQSPWPLPSAHSRAVSGHGSELRSCTLEQGACWRELEGSTRRGDG